MQEAEGFYPGQEYSSIRARLLSDKQSALAAGIYQYSTRKHVVMPYAVASHNFRGGIQPYLGALRLNTHFVEMHYGVYVPVRKLRFRLDHQSGHRKAPDIWVLDVAAHATRRLEVMPMLYMKKTQKPRFYVGLELTQELR